MSIAGLDFIFLEIKGIIKNCLECGEWATGYLTKHGGKDLPRFLDFLLGRGTYPVRANPFSSSGIL